MLSECIQGGTMVMELEEVLEQCLGQNFVHMIISNPKKGDFAGKVGVR